MHLGLDLALDPSQSLFLFDGDDFSLRLGDPALSGQGYPSEAKEEDFSASWQRSLAKSLDYPRFGEGKKVALPDQLAEEEPKFSGFVRYEKELKEEAEALFADMGLSLNAACRMFLKRAVMEQRIPFEVRRIDRKTLKALAEAEQGKNVSGSFDSVDKLMEELEK